MTAAPVPVAIDVAGSERTPLSWAVADTLVLTKRNLLRYLRVPELLVFTFIQPVMFTLLFRYVFGGAIPIPGVDYVDYLMPGIFVQTLIFGAVGTGIGLADDLSSGIVDRFRSLPMARMAVLAGRTLADLIRNTFVVTLMLVVGILVGFRPDGGLAGMAAGLAIVLSTSFAMSWLFAIVGLRSANAEAAQAVAFPLVFPLTFASSAFVPTSSMPGWLQAFAEHQPVTMIVNAVRGLMLGPDVASALQQADVFQMSTGAYTIRAVAWVVLALAIAAPMAVRRYRRAV